MRRSTKSVRRFFSRSALPRLGLLSLSVFGGACAHYPKEDGERLHNEVYALQTLTSTMHQGLRELRQVVEQQSGQIAGLTKEVTELNASKRRNDADFVMEIEEMRREFARVKGRVETFGERVSGLESGLSKAQGELDARFEALAEQRKIDLAKNEEERRRALEEAQRRERLLATPASLFAEVEGLIRDKKTDEAERLLRDFVIRAEDSKRLGKYLAQAQYFIGETYFVVGAYQQAAAEYNQVRKKYAKDKTWAPQALLKLGMCFEEMSSLEDAKLFYEAVIQKYRKSDAAKKAKERLKKLKG